jgi:hypothetical protein
MDDILRSEDVGSASAGRRVKNRPVKSRFLFILVIFMRGVIVLVAYIDYYNKVDRTAGIDLKAILKGFSFCANNQNRSSTDYLLPIPHWQMLIILEYEDEYMTSELVRMKIILPKID